MHLAIETGLPVFTLTSPQAVQISDPNHDQNITDYEQQETIPGCLTCGTTNIEEIGYSAGLPVWECCNGHRSHEVEEIAVMPDYVATALAELAAHCWGEYDFPGDTARDEHGRAA